MKVVIAAVAPVHEPTPSKSMFTPSPSPASVRLVIAISNWVIRLLHATEFVRIRWVAASPNSVAVSTTSTPLLCAHSTTGEVFQEPMLSALPLVEFTAYEK